MKRIIYAVLLFVLCFNLNAHSQDDNSVIKNAVAGLKTLQGNHIIEKAYLHFDKPYYAAGDTIYFKAYVTLGERHDLSKASGILYVDLIDPNNTIVNSIKLQLVNGIAWGDFSLPFSLPKGNYRIRAYTRYMQNDADYIFDQPIPIGSIMNNPVAANASNDQSGKADIQFFPEGGDLVTAMISKVAFKAIGANGLGVNAKGIIVDNTDKQVAAFTSSHLGMGAFYMVPMPGKTYKAKVTFADGTQNTFAMPVPLSKGIVLSMQDTLDKISVEIRCNKAYLDENLNKEVSLVMYDGGVVNTVKAKLDSRILNMELPNSQFPSGVLQATLFSQNGEPLSERLLFLKNPDLVNLTVNSKKASYGKRERVSISINAKDKGNDVEGHFSAAVIDESKVPFDENNETTILTYLLLTSDLSGYVEQPNYYFTHNTAQTYADLDALMLTQGYRRYAWKQLLSNIDTKFNYEPEKTLQITGIAKTASGSPVTNMDVMLLTSNSGSMLGDKTGNDGKFAFYNLPPFADNSLFTLQATGSTKTRGTTVLTVFPDKAGLAVADKKLPGLQSDVNASMIAYLSNSQAQNNNIYNGIAVRQSGEQHTEQVINGDELRGSTSLVTALNGRLNDVNFVNGLPYLKGGSTKDPMLIVVDGKIRGSYVNLDNINPGDVGKIEVLKGSSANNYGIYGGAGVLSITSRAGTSNGIMQDASYKYTSKTVVKQKNVYTEDSKAYRSSNYGGSGHADQVVKGDILKNATSLSQGLSGLLVGVNFINGMPYLPSNMVLTNGAMVVEPMYIMLDGSPYTPTGEGINDVAPNSVETIEILKGPNASIYGVNGGAGVMVITTREHINGTQSDGAALGSLAFRAKGFYKAREFYSPKYENTTANDLRDLRSTIFWAPEVITNKDGFASFEYYNADGRGTYRVVIEGVDEKGNIGRQVYRYKVE